MKARGGDTRRDEDGKDSGIKHKREIYIHCILNAIDVGCETSRRLVAVSAKAVGGCQESGERSPKSFDVLGCRIQDTLGIF